MPKEKNQSNSAPRCNQSTWASTQRTRTAATTTSSQGTCFGTRAARTIKLLKTEKPRRRRRRIPQQKSRPDRLGALNKDIQNSPGPWSVPPTKKHLCTKNSEGKCPIVAATLICFCKTKTEIQYALPRNQSLAMARRGRYLLLHNRRYFVLMLTWLLNTHYFSAIKYFMTKVNDIQHHWSF